MMTFRSDGGSWKRSGVGSSVEVGKSTLELRGHRGGGPEEGPLDPLLPIVGMRGMEPGPFGLSAGDFT
jgi:hypothetical protein